MLGQVIHSLPPAIQRIVVVTGPDNTAIRNALADYPVDYAINVDPAAGMGNSLAAGAALVDNCSAVLVCLGDMPLVKTATIEALLTAFNVLSPTAVCLPIQAGRTGHPVLFGAAHLPALRNLSGDTGARSLLAGLDICKVSVDDPGIFLDIDTPADLAALTAES